ncbi:LuxR C-terminal-related transcriptional regulator [Kribbella sp. NPDC051587]|uniref:LuxR C-terminal-related transcriptional regulator n=1 Tax=Kribbella sp. NPDC051587 TaxID=3364119 RepID=UPI00378DC4EA
MHDHLAARRAIQELLPERMERLRRVAGVPVVLGGATRYGPDGTTLVLDRTLGTYGDALIGLSIPAGRGLGGCVIRQRVPLRVHDYATAMGITHDFDYVVVGVEELTSILAVPILIHGEVRGVVYGAARDHRPLGDRAVRAATVMADQLQQDIERRLTEQTTDPTVGPTTALAELAAVIRETAEPSLRARLVRIQRGLINDPTPKRCSQRLSPREVDTLKLVEIGESNLEIATRLGISVETVKAYLRSAMRKLEVHNRTAAAHRARLSGEL